MKQAIFSILILLFIICCKSFPKEYIAIGGVLVHSEDTNCTELFKEISIKWAKYRKKINEKECYYYNKKLTDNILSHKYCFRGLDTSDLFKLFGVPTRIDTLAGNYNYLMSKNLTTNFDFINDEYYWLMFIGQDTINDVVRYQISTIY